MAKSKEAAPNAPMGFDTPSSGAAVRPDASDRPVCPKHFVAMKAYSSPESVTYYKCLVEGCEETSKKSRRADTSFPEPKSCSRAACNGRPLEVDGARSTPMTLTMVCPDCGEEQRHPRPGVRPRVSERAPEPDFAER